MTLVSTPAVAGPARKKLQGYEFYREVLGSPKFIVAPMVDQSELAWRKLSRRYGAQLVYTPMINAKMFAADNRKAYREQQFNTEFGEEGGPEDRPLFVQFCANDPEQLLASAKVVEPHCDAIDINLGCPQEIAKKGHYGAFLQDDWDLIYRLINTLHTNLSIPVTAKFRVFPSVEKTVAYAQMLERAGAQILTCHGRLREQRGHNTGLADWAQIRAVKQAVSVPVFANGNILYHADLQRCLDATGADGVMSAEGQLYNAALFAASSTPGETGAHPRHADLALEYLALVGAQRTPTPPGAVKGHLFKLMRPALARETDLRDRLGRVRGAPGKDKGWAAALEEYVAIAEEMKRRMDRDAEGGNAGGEGLPHWVAQPYFRPLPVETVEKEKGVVKQEAGAKRAHSARTPEPSADDQLKRVKLDVVDALDPPPDPGAMPASVCV
ncbi:Dus-domain-containing protein [Auriscalpium vulgare]|uniref:Dus-domain-containing protein n=1 Tax=Auriscalpium vulgare TaxID=40419 RepID=A0ACB8RIR1_9AGAM|nr:Dus-domain-containing protein [Auriscalpium vulgare]